MRKSFLFTVLAVAALVSCSRDHVVDVNKGDGISFRASLDRAVTYAGETNLQNLGSFNVTAIGNSKNYFTNLSVTSSDRGANWTTASTYYWPNYELAFFAYAPQTPGGTVSISNAAKKITGFSPEQNVAQQKDLMVAYNKGTKATNENTGIPLNFNHALSQIEIKAKCSNDKIKIEVMGVKVVNAAAKGDLTFPETNTLLDHLNQDKWGNLTEKNDHSKAYMIKGENPLTLTADAQSIMFNDGNFMLIPQQLTKWNGTTVKEGAYLSVLCRISSLDDTNETLLFPEPTANDTKDNKYGFSAVGIETNWIPGNKYIYTLNFCGDGGGAGRIDPNPSNPTDPNDSKVDQNPIDGGSGGDLILGKPIKFTVTVDAWTPQQMVDVAM